MGQIGAWGLRDLNFTSDVIFQFGGVVIIIISEWAKLHNTGFLRNGFSLIWSM